MSHFMTKKHQAQQFDLSYTYPLAKQLSLEIGYRPAWEHSQSDWIAMRADSADDYDILDSTLGNIFETTFLTHRRRLRMRFHGNDKSEWGGGNKLRTHRKFD